MQLAELCKMCLFWGFQHDLADASFSCGTYPSNGDSLTSWNWLMTVKNDIGKTTVYLPGKDLSQAFQAKLKSLCIWLSTLEIFSPAWRKIRLINLEHPMVQPTQRLLQFLLGQLCQRAMHILPFCVVQGGRTRGPYSAYQGRINKVKSCANRTPGCAFKPWWSSKGSLLSAWSTYRRSVFILRSFVSVHFRKVKRFFQRKTHWPGNQFIESVGLVYSVKRY